MQQPFNQPPRTPPPPPPPRGPQPPPPRGPQPPPPAGDKPPKDIMGFLEYYLVTKAPFQIPDKWREWFVKYIPWIDVVLLVLLLPLILVALGLSAVTMPLMGKEAVGGVFSWIVLLARVALQIAALPGLFKRKIQGWNFAFYGTVVTLFYDLIHVDIISGIIGALISLYVLFQIKSYYK